MKVLALIPARKGSKRLPGKNLRKLGGKPLIRWTIDVAKQIQGFCDILVSTDGEEIAAVARDAGVMVPWMRPADLASDYASSADVAIHALDWYESVHGKIDSLVLLQPTSPFRSIQTIENGLIAFEKYARRSVMSVSRNTSQSSGSFMSKGNFIHQIQFGGIDLAHKSESLIFYVPNGVLYIISPEVLRNEKTFASGEIVPLLIDSQVELIDIDTLDDWKSAEKIVAATQF